MQVEQKRREKRELEKKQSSTYLGVKHNALGGQTHVALRFDQSIYDDRFATTCWAHKHGRVPGHHGFVHLHHFVFLCMVREAMVVQVDCCTVCSAEQKVMAVAKAKKALPVLGFSCHKRCRQADG